MSKKEQQRAHVLVLVVEGHLAVPDAAGLLGLSCRHLRRLLAKVRQDGPAALAPWQPGTDLPAPPHRRHPDSGPHPRPHALCRRE